MKVKVREYEKATSEYIRVPASLPLNLTPIHKTEIAESERGDEGSGEQVMALLLALGI